jgi:hypothetical protein
MKMTAWALMVFTLVLFVHEQQATASSIEGYIVSSEPDYAVLLGRGNTSRKYIYSVEYTIGLLVGNDNLGCSLRLGTKSSNTKLLNISGPLTVRNVTDPLKFFDKIGKNLFGLAGHIKSDFSGLPFKC